MKKINIIVLISCAVFFFASCTKDQRAGAHFGTEISFSGNSKGADFTKAHYSGFTEGDIERIEWNAGDTVSIYCSAASKPSSKQAIYKIKDGSISSSGVKSSGKLVVKDTIGLCWGSGSHTFYAAWPAVGNKVTQSINGNTIKANLPFNQPGESIKWSSGDAVIIPDFGYQLLAAKAGPYTEAEGLPNDVALSFIPLCTAIQFTFENGRGARIDKIDRMELVSAGTQITGDFAVDMDDLTTAGDGFPKVTPNPDGKTLTWQDKSVRIGRSTELNDGKKITFTVFLLPGQDINDLSFVVYFTASAGGGSLKTRLGYTDGTGVVFKRCKKTIVEGIILPNGVQWSIDYNPFLTEWENDGGEIVTL